MRNRIWCVLLLIYGLVFRTMGQELSDIEKLLDDNGILSSEDGYEEMVGVLMNLADAPVNVNTAGFDSLKTLFFLSDYQIDQILAFREKNGCFLHPNELLLVYGIGQRDLRNILPFITLGNSLERVYEREGAKRVKQDLIARARLSLPLQEGYQFYVPDDFEKRKDYEKKMENRFQGMPVGMLLKYKLEMNHRWQIGVTLENDPGEAYFTPDQKMGFDFLSAHIALTTKRFLRHLVVGDYRIRWGQGLVVWGGFLSGKSDISVGNEKSGQGVSPYTSANENNYLRGVALSMGLCRNVVSDVFFSLKKTDGNLTAGKEPGIWRLVSLYEGGYHRNRPECLKKQVLDEMTTGLSIRWNTVYFKVGLNSLYYDYDPALVSGNSLYQQFNDKGEKRYLVSVDYKASFRGIYGFGEVARNDNGSWAIVNGLRGGASFISGCLLYRRYDRRYVSRYAAGFGEYSNTSNEEGVYGGVAITLLRDLKINLSGDWFHFFSPRYRAYTPSHGYEVMGEVSYTHSSFEHTGRVKYEIKPEDLSGGIFARRKRGDFRYEFQYRQGQCLEWRTRISVSHYRKEERREWGYMVYQDVIFAARRVQFKMQCRAAWFDTDSYESRIYAYENNVLYGYSFPFFMGSGGRAYLNMNWKPVDWLTCYFKSGLTVYTDRNKIGSGLTEVQGNRLYDFTFQLRFCF
ncbi:MAG: helix-hairpin-helix domain-containing protein [Odoribacter sp.]